MGTIKDVNDRLTETIIALNNRFQEFSDGATEGRMSER